MKFLTPLIIIAICGGMYFLYISPTAIAVRVLSQKKLEYNNALEKSKELKDTRDVASVDYNSISGADIDRLNKIIPDSFNSVIFANTINTMASQYSLSVKDFKVNNLKTDTREVIVDTQKKNPYKTIVVTFRLNGQYPNFLRFLTSLESDLRLVDVTGLSLKPIGGGRVTESSYEYLLEVHTYSLR